MRRSSRLRHRLVLGMELGRKFSEGICAAAAYFEATCTATSFENWFREAVPEILILLPGASMLQSQLWIFTYRRRQFEQTGLISLHWIWF